MKNSISVKLDTMECLCLVTLVQNRIKEGEELVRNYPHYARDTHYSDVLDQYYKTLEKLMTAYTDSCEVQK